MRYRTCGWCATNCWRRRDECACKQARGRKSGANDQKWREKWREDASKTAAIAASENIGLVALTNPSCSGHPKELDKEKNPIDALIDQVEKIKAGIRAKVEHPFRVIKRQFGYTKVRYRGLKKNTLQLKTLFALSNLWMVRHQLLAAQG